MIDKAALFAPRLPEQDVEIPGVGTIRVRALTRLEAGQVERRGAGDIDGKERLILSFGMVDPELTEAEAGQWMKLVTPGEITTVAMTIAELSGLLEGSPKATFPGDGSGPVD